MAPLPVVTDAAQITLHGVGPSGLQWENVFGFIVNDTTLTQAIADVLSGQIADAYGLLELSDTFQAESITLTDLREADGVQFESTEGWPVAGGVASQPLPLQTAGLISWGTSHRGKSFRGRTYICGFAETGSDGAHMATGAHTSLADFADALIAMSTPLGIISRYSGVDPDTHLPIPRDPGIISEVTSRVVHDLWATQRRRAPRS